MYLGASIMSFALPYGAFIVGALALFFLFRARHSGPRLKYLQPGSVVTSVTTREPGPAPAPAVAADEAKPAAKAEGTAKGSESKEGGE